MKQTKSGNLPNYPAYENIPLTIDAAATVMILSQQNAVGTYLTSLYICIHTYIYVYIV